jgi:3-methyladenine DNA glycosylase AlkD
LSKNNIVKQAREALKAASTPEAKASSLRFFKEKISAYGVKSADLSRIEKEYFRKIKDMPAEGILDICEKIMERGVMEERILASKWAEKISDKFIEQDFKRLEKWVKNHISNWAECDTLCNHAVGSFISEYPEYIKELKKWARSDSRWVKRASCVSLILPARRGEFLADVFELSDILRDDPDDMVQKGYGWLLKEASRKHTKEVFKYVLKYKDTMPRTALRYAIEKMPANLKKKAMTK